MIHLTPFRDLEEEANKISSFLQTELETNSEDLKLHGDEIEAKGHQIAIYLARTGDMLADAKYYLNKIMKSDVLRDLIQDMEITFLSATAQKKFLESAAPVETRLVDFIERLNKSCTHQLDWYRSVLSKKKEEMRLHGYGT